MSKNIVIVFFVFFLGGSVWSLYMYYDIPINILRVQWEGKSSEMCLYESGLKTQKSSIVITIPI